MKVVSSSDPIDCLNFNPRTYHALRRGGILYVEDLLLAKEKDEILRIHNIGEKAYEEIIRQIENCQIVNSTIPNESVNISGTNNFYDETDKTKLMLEKYKIYYNAIIELVDWQKQQIKKQIKMNTLHPNVKVFGKTIMDILEKDDKGLIWKSKVYSKTLNTTYVVEELAYLVEGISSRDLEVFLKYYGFPNHTLQEISIPLEITRERVRQILVRIKKIISRRFRMNFFSESDNAIFTSFTRIQTALLLAEQLGDEITYNYWASQITRSGLLGNWNDISEFSCCPIELLLAVCKILSKIDSSVFNLPENLKFAYELAVKKKPNEPAKNLIIKKTLDRKIKKEILRHSCFSGGINAKWLSHQTNIPLKEITDILLVFGFYNAFTDWFIEKKPRVTRELNKNHTFEHALRKMIQYCGPLKIESIISGLRHAVSRTKYPVPPPNVMEKILEDKGYTNEEDLWYWDGEIDEKLNEGEKTILKCFYENGPVVHHSELAQTFIDSDLSFAALHATLRRTPIIEKFDYALYRLRGLKVTYEEIQRAKNEGDKIPVDLEIVPDKAGIIKIFGNLGILPVGTGAFCSENLPNLVGEWKCVVGDKQCGNITVVDNEIRGLLVAFESLHCEVGDRVSMSFNTWDRKLSIQKVS